MKRRAEKELTAWLHSTPRKPLVVNGARQVGKTWLVTDFAKRHFESTAHVVFLNNEEAQRAFDGSLDANRLLMLIGALTGTNPRDGKTLVFLDEIQECPRAIAALKLFCEQTPGIPIVAAGSMLGVALNRRGSHEQPISWPVGKVSYLNLFPMTFDEFLVAANPQLAGILEEDNPTLADMVSERLTELLKTYMFVGGMPEAVAVFLQTGDPAAARKVQSDLLLGYEYDFSKHVDSPLMTERIRETWRSAPSQLATESDMKRFTYAAIKPRARGRDYRDAVTWLVDAGLATRVARVSKPGIPLEGYADNVYFKLYLLDVGLLGAATRLGAPVLLNGNQHFTEYKGAYAEQFVCQHLLAREQAERGKKGEGRKQTRRHADQTMGHDAERDRPARHAGRALAEIRRPKNRRTARVHRRDPGRDPRYGGAGFPALRRTVRAARGAFLRALQARPRRS